MSVVVDDAAAERSGVEHAGALTAFAGAVVMGSEADITAARNALISAMGQEAMVDAAAVIATFQRMNRISDGTGLVLDAPMNAMSTDLRDTLGLGDFPSAARTKRSSATMSVLSKLLFPLVMKFFRPPKPPR